MNASSDPEEKTRRARARLAAAPAGGEWDEALKAVAEVCGGWIGSILSISAQRGLKVCFGSGVTDEIVSHYLRANGYRPDKNARAAAMYAAAPMRPYAEADFIAEQDWRKSQYFREFCEPTGVPHSIFAKLSVGSGAYFIAVGRTETQGPVMLEERKAFAALLEPIDAALRLQTELETRALSLAARSWDAIRAPAFFCGPDAKLLAASAAGERALSEGRFVTLRRGRLRLADPTFQDMVDARIAFACHIHDTAPAIANLPITAVTDRESCLFAVAPAPGERMGAPAVSCALVLLLERAVRAAPRAMGLTDAERQIAQGLLDGLTTRAIAESRGVSISTVQTQIKALHHKLQVSHRAELIAALRALIV